MSNTMSDGLFGQQLPSDARYLSATAAREQTRLWPALLLMLPVVVGLRLAGLTHQSLWFDEGYTLQLATAATPQEFLRIFGTFTTSEHLQPLYYVIIFLWSRIAGTSDAALRLPSALFSVLSSLCVYRIVVTTARTHARSLAAAALGLFACMSYSIYYAQEARPYALIQCLGLVVITTWLDIQRVSGEGKRGLISPFAVMCALAVLSSVFNGLLVAVLAMADLTRREGRAGWTRLWTFPLLLSFALFLGYAIAGHYLFASVIGRDFVSIKQPLWMNLLYTGYGVLFGTTLGPSSEALRGSHTVQVLANAWPQFLLALVAATGFVVLLQLIARIQMDTAFTITLRRSVLLYIAVFVCVFGIVGKLNILPRHASSLFALGMAVVASSIADIPVLLRKRPGLKVPLVGTALIFALLNAISLRNYYLGTEYRKDDYRAIAAELPKDGLPVFMPEGQPLLMRHYGVEVISVANINPGALAEVLRQRSVNSARLRIVDNLFRNNLWDRHASVQSTLSAQYECTPEASAAYMVVMQCSAKTLGRTSVTSADRISRAH